MAKSSKNKKSEDSISSLVKANTQKEKEAVAVIDAAYYTNRFHLVQ